MGLLLGATGTHPWADWKKQRIIDTPHYRRNDELLRYVVWRNNTFGLHVHVAISGADRAIAVVAATAELPAGAARPVGELAVRRGREHRAPLGAHADLHAVLPALRRPGRVRRRGRSTRASSASSTTRARSPSTRSSGGAFARTSRSRPSRSGSATASPSSPRRSRSRRSPRRSPRAIARAYDEGEPVEPLPHRLIEENFWRAIRWGLAGRAARLRPRRAPIPARQRLEELIEWVLPVAEEIGAAPYLAVPGRNAAERQIERFEDGASLEEIYAEQVRVDGDDRWLTSSRRRRRSSARRSTGSASRTSC